MSAGTEYAPKQRHRTRGAGQGMAQEIGSAAAVRRIPNFDELPVKEGAPPESSWGVFGDDDGIGCLNFLTPDGVVEAARLIQTVRGAGYRFSTQG